MLDYIKKLADNIPIPDKPKDIDIVIEGGCFNGLYSMGALLLIKELENRRYFKVHRISGASIGSIIGFAYLSNTLLDVPTYFEKIRECFKNKLNLSIVKDIIKENVMKLTDDEFEIIKNNKFFVSYTKNGKQIFRNKFKNKKKLLNSILKSIHIPYLTTGHYYHMEGKNKYLDGGQPFIFNNRDKNDKRQIFYLDNSNILTMFSIQNEINSSGRMIEGALQCYNYILKEKRGFLCSYVNKWTHYDYLLVRLKRVFCLVLIYSMYFFEHYTPLILGNLYNTEFFSNIKSFLKCCAKDFILFNCL